MAIDTRARRPRANGRTRLTVIDTDVHHGVRANSDLLPYLPHVYKERFADYGLGGGGGVYANNGGQNGKRVDAIGTYWAWSRRSESCWSSAEANWARSKAGRPAAKPRPEKK